jgi:HEAT repeat protein
MGFILQLFIIPMVIVTIIVLIWLLFNWLAHMGSNPADLVTDLKKFNDSSWQKALTLADLLRNPRYEYLKRDAELAKELASVLDRQLDGKDMDQKSIRLRVFLCRALGEFQTPEVLPVLLRAATTERQLPEAEVRLSALQSLAVFTRYNHPESLRTDEKLTETLLNASREQSQGVDTQHTRAEMRSQAAYALGMLGGTAALSRLEIMIGDAYPNARYNAAIGLCRHGDLRALPGLLEMLDPENVEAVSSEEKEESKPWKRLNVMQNGLRAAVQLIEKNKSDDLSELGKALDTIIASDLARFDSSVRRGIRISAEEAKLSLKERSKRLVVISH